MTEGSNTENETISLSSVSLKLSGAIVTVNQDDSSASELSDDDDDDDKKLQLPNSAIPPNSVVNVENSSDVIIGTVTQFHGPVTIYQNTHNNTALQSEVPCYQQQISAGGHVTSSAAKLVAAESLSSKRLSKFKELPRKKLILIAFTIVLILISSSVLISIAVRKLYTNKDTDHSQETATVKQNLQNSTHKFVERYRWGGRESLNPESLHTPVKYIIISHTSGRFCTDFANCCREMQKAQSEAVVTGHPDVTYNFVIGGDGNIYIGRGWDVKNDHKLPIDTIDISFIGNFVYNKLTDTMIDAAKKLLEAGVSLGKIDKYYKLYAHNHTENTVSPGSYVYSVIKTWPHYTNDLLTERSL